MEGKVIMKVLQITSHYNEGGAARVAACIHKQLLENGIESKIVYGRGKKIQDDNVIKFDKDYEIYISALLSRVTGINGWWNHSGTRRLIKLIEDFRPDIIHMHTLHGYYVNLPMLWNYINKKQIPVVWTFHDCHAFVGNCGYFFECNKWEDGCFGCTHLREYPKSQWFDFTHWMWKRKRELFTQSEKKVIVSPSDWLTKVAQKSFFKKYPCVTIHNGIDTDNVFYPRDKMKMREKYGFDQADKIILGVAVEYKDPRKGAKYIIQMARELPNVKVILIGWEASNNNMLKDVHNVITLPVIKSTSVLAEYYSLADVFVLPSLAENYATTTLEAMACGTPVVGFDVGGISEQLSGGKGIIVEAKNQEKFTKAVKDASENSNEFLEREQIASAVKVKNSIKTMTEEYMKIYEQLLKV